MPRSEMLAAICATRRCLAVAGTHGKTTTASMLSLILVEAGLRPSFVIGADVNEIGTNAVWDTGEWLVVEADESYGTFQVHRARPGRAHQRRAGPPRLLRHVRRAARAPSTTFVAAARRGRGGVRRRPRGGGHRAGARARHGRDRGGRDLRHGRPRARSGARSSFTLHGPEGDARAPARRRPGPAQRPQRGGGRRRPRCSAAPPSRRRRPRWRASPA